MGIHWSMVNSPLNGPVIQSFNAPFIVSPPKAVERSICSVTRDSMALSWRQCYDPLNSRSHDDVIKWKHFSRYWPFVWGIHRSPVNSPHKGQWRGTLMFSLICAWINGWVNNGDAGDWRRHRAHHDVTVMTYSTTNSRFPATHHAYDAMNYNLIVKSVKLQLNGCQTDETILLISPKVFYVFM